MKETIYDLKKFVEKIDTEKTIHYRWHVGSSYHSKFEIVFELSCKAKDGDYVKVYIKKYTLDKEINERVDKFVKHCLEEVKEELEKEPEWGSWE